jgi:sugar phosphate isomerase/epimerase
MRSLFAFFCSAVALLAADRPPFFAMDTAARLEPAECAQVLADLGYAGLGGRPASAKAHAAALQSKGLVFFNGYHVTNFGYGQTELPADLAKAVDDLAGTGSTLWLGINKVAFPAGVRAGPEYGDTIVVPQLKQLLAYAKTKGVKVSLYPHTGFWAAQFEVCLRVANKVDDPNLGVTFNLCHFLKVQPADDLRATLEAAKPLLWSISLCGADAGGKDWNTLIRPLDEGDFDKALLLGHLREIGFKGPVGLQCFNIRIDPKQNLARSMEAWKKLLATQRSGVSR